MRHVRQEGISQSSRQATDNRTPQYLYFERPESRRKNMKIFDNILVIDAFSQQFRVVFTIPNHQYKTFVILI